MNADSSLPVTAEKSFLPNRSDDEGGIDLGQIIDAIRRRLLLVAGVTTVVASAAVLKALTDTPIYEASFEILTNPVTLETRIISAANPQTLSNQQDVVAVSVDEAKLKILKSPKVIDPVVEELQETFPAIDYGDVARGLTVQPTSQDILTVTYQHPDPAVVTAVLDVVEDAFLQFSLEERQRDILRGIDFVDEQLPQLRSRVDALQSQLEALRRQYNLIDPEAQGQQLTQQISSFSQERLDIRVQLNEAKLLYDNLDQQLDQQGELAAASLLNENPRYQSLLDKLLEIDTQLAEDSVLFMGESPEIQYLREQRQQLLPLLAQEGQRTERQLVSMIRELETRDQALGQAIDQLNQRMKVLSSVARRYSDIQRELQIATENLNQFLSKREALRIDAAQRQTPWELLSQPGNPRASAASVKRNLLLGSVLGVLLGIGAALLIDRLSSVIYTPKELKSLSKLPLLGVIPFNEYLERYGPAASVATRLRQAGYILNITNKADEQEQSQASTPFIESFRSLYASLRLLNPDRSLTSLTVSSATPGAGKTTVCLHLGQAAAAMGRRVLLVDTDLRRPSLHKKIGMKNAKGLTDYIASPELSIEEVTQPVPLDDNLSIITAGSLPPDPTKVLSSRRMEEFIGMVNQQFDLVIYDTPPLLGFADAFLTGVHSNGFLMVVGLGKVKRTVFQQALEDLKVSMIPVLGLVANGAKEDQMASSYSYYQYYTQDEALPSQTNGALKTEPAGLLKSLKDLPIVKSMTKK
ncbi:Tyrosine-protein kinase etk [Halomicronema hongdechloris C2206]|uniref:Tyrosine-protein kinase etk n=1 Tax=Halomicronema hongdechloris C2206 TaxID=1641165 RepID=A0A1Z3HNG3_9CYAN|nr:polysaccharide biosynthesis tyrosine autokinase [Halomicronema hongdechloris]ASC71854.1 Tyrosine-protein kinase etk [Halomicronema hongdechloris C2206]